MAETHPAFLNHSAMSAQDFFRVNEYLIAPEIVRRFHDGIHELKVEKEAIILDMKAEKEEGIRDMEEERDELEEIIKKLNKYIDELLKCARALAEIHSENIGAENIFLLYQLEISRTLKCAPSQYMTAKA